MTIFSLLQLQQQQLLHIPLQKFIQFNEHTNYIGIQHVNKFGISFTEDMNLRTMLAATAMNRATLPAQKLFVN